MAQYAAVRAEFVQQDRQYAHLVIHQDIVLQDQPSPDRLVVDTEAGRLVHLVAAYRDARPVGEGLFRQGRYAHLAGVHLVVPDRGLQVSWALQKCQWILGLSSDQIKVLTWQFVPCAQVASYVDADSLCAGHEVVLDDCRLGLGGVNGAVVAEKVTGRLVLVEVAAPHVPGEEIAADGVVGACDADAVLDGLVDDVVLDGDAAGVEDADGDAQAVVEGGVAQVVGPGGVVGADVVEQEAELDVLAGRAVVLAVAGELDVGDAREAAVVGDKVVHDGCVVGDEDAEAVKVGFLRWVGLGRHLDV